MRSKSISRNCGRSVSSCDRHAPASCDLSVKLVVQSLLLAFKSDKSWLAYLLIMIMKNANDGVSQPL